MKSYPKTRFVDLVLVLLAIAWTTTSSTTAAYVCYSKNINNSMLRFRKQPHRKPQVVGKTFGQVQQLTQKIRPSRISTALCLSFQPPYGRGAEIWPENNDDIIQLKDSFPNGKLPDIVLKTLQIQQDYMLNDDEFEEVVNEVQEATTTPTASTTTTKVKGSKRKRFRTSIKRILKRAALRSQIDDQQQTEGIASTSDQRSMRDITSLIQKIPAVIIFSLLISGYVKPLDLLLVTFLSGYFIILGMWAKSPRSTIVNGNTSAIENNEESNDDIAIASGNSATTSLSLLRRMIPYLPALPPQGHVPILVSNPLGYSFAYSYNYDRWLNAGVYLSLILPLAYMILSTIFTAVTTITASAAPPSVGRGLIKLTRGAVTTFGLGACARPIFLLCCQILSEGISKQVLTPLPIRILIPVAYNIIRLGYLWDWCFTMILSSGSTALVGGPVIASTSTAILIEKTLLICGKFLSVFNFLYWFVNLFGFLLPIGVIRYMRAYFFTVEAKEVIIREGLEESVGL